MSPTPFTRNSPTATSPTNSSSLKLKKMNPWIEAMRLRTLPVSTAGVFAGSACAFMAGAFRWLPALICLIFAILAQIASNFANEYYDFKNGLDRQGRDGFRRGVTEGDISPRAMKRATYLLLLLDAAVGCCLIPFGGWWLIPIGAAIALFALAYSAGPYPLSHHGLGDVAVIIFFGLVPVTLTAYVQTGSWTMLPYTLPIALAVGLLAANVLIVNNYRDMDDDAAVGKRTTVVIFGRSAMARTYLIFALSAILISILTLLFLSPYSPFPSAASPCVSAAASFPSAASSCSSLSSLLVAVIILAISAVIPVKIWRNLRANSGAALNPLLGRTALYLLFFSLILFL